MTKPNIIMTEIIQADQLQQIVSKIERIEQENQYKLQSIEGTKHEEFLESWIKFVIRKEATNFEEIDLLTFYHLHIILIFYVY